VTATESGGTGPYTFAWSRVSGAVINIDTPAVASTTFTGTPGVDGILTGVYKCVVTDSAGTPETFEKLINVTLFDITNGFFF